MCMFRFHPDVCVYTGLIVFLVWFYQWDTLKSNALSIVQMIFQYQMVVPQYTPLLDAPVYNMYK